jgi:hypothetical protein
MKNFNLETLGVIDIENIKLMEINGGQAAPSPWWSIVSPAIQAGVIAMEAYANAYIKFSAETGGKYVIHHAY